MSELTLSGSCLCGTVNYEVTGEAAAFYHCHCRRCRKASGTGHASNVILRPGKVRWISGEDELGRYDVPDAERYHTRWCRNCGCPVPRINDAMKLVVLPAGSLDDELPIKPQARIFWGSRTDWSCGNAEFQQYEEYVTQE